MDLEDIRREYVTSGLSRDRLDPSPVKQFEAWLKQAFESKLADPTAMVLATVSSEGFPSQRIVLLKHLDDDGFVFYTNYSSAKAQDIGACPKVSLHFPWHPIERQVKILGEASKISTVESLKYFSSRPRDSQLAAWASNQSARIGSRELLMLQFEKMKFKFANGQIPLPDFWGGYRVKPCYFEFWQGRENRLHDRFAYSLTDSQGWDINRLSP